MCSRAGDDCTDGRPDLELLDLASACGNARFCKASSGRSAWRHCRQNSFLLMIVHCVRPKSDRPWKQRAWTIQAEDPCTETDESSGAAGLLTYGPAAPPLQVESCVWLRLHVPAEVGVCLRTLQWESALLIGEALGTCLS